MGGCENFKDLKQPFPVWIQRICPAPRRHLQQLIIKHNLSSGLDIGCGENSPLSAIRKSFAFRSTGIDTSPNFIESSKQKKLHDEYILADFIDFEFRKTFDVVVLSNVIEHFTRDEGMRVLNKAELLTRRLIYVETPYGFLEQTDIDGNPFQRHLSGWYPHDFEARGYTVFGSGVRLLRGPEGKAKYLPEGLVRFISRALQWYYFRRPKEAFIISAIRYFDEYGNVKKV